MSLELKVITEVNDNGYLSFNDKTFNVYAAQGSIDNKTARNYIVVDNANNAIEDNNVEEPEERDVNNETPNAAANTEDNTTEEEQEKTATDSENVSLNDLKEFLLSTFQKYPSGLMQFPYFWQYKLSQDQYGRLKKILLDLHLQRHRGLLQKEPCGTGLGTVARAVALFISEWYKRECESLDGAGCFDLIGLTAKSELVWRHSGISDSLLHHEEGNQMRQTALCVLGGFPLKYIKKKEERFKKFIKSLCEIDNYEDISEDVIDEVVDRVDDNNGVFKRSLQSGSCHKYLLALINYLRDKNKSCLPFCEEDLSINPFDEFFKILENGYNDVIQDFFKIDWDFYLESSMSDCDCTLILHIGPQYYECYIPEEILSRANVPNANSLRDFFLYIDYNNGEKISKFLRFSRSAGMGTPFVGWGKQTIIHLPVVPKVGNSIAIKMVDVNDVNKENTYTLKEFSVDGYFHLFKTNNPYEWSSLTNNKALSVLLYSPTRYSIKCSNDNNEDIFIGQDIWQLLYLYDDAKLEDLQTNNVIDFRIKKGVLSIEFEKLPNIIQYNKKQEISYSFNVDDNITNESMPLMLGKDGIKRVVLYPFEKNEQPTSFYPGRSRDLIIKYKQESFNYKTFEDGLPQTGILSLCVSCGNHTIVKKCFYVSNPKFVDRNLDNSQFVFSLSDASVFQYGDIKLESKVESNKIIFPEDKDYLPHMDYLTFCVGTKTDYANINIYRARECRELYFEDHRFTEFGNPYTLSNIPFILREKFRLRIIDREGVKNVFCGHDVWMNPDVNLQNIIEDISTNRNNPNIKRDNVNGIAYYQYVSKRTENAEYGHYSISSKVFHKYKFFYWNMRSNSAPIPLETVYDQNRSELSIKLNEFDESGIVFQSLKDEQPYNYLFPILSNPTENWMLKRNRVYRDNVILNCFKFASEHKVYFAMFYPIRNKVTNQKSLFSLFEQLCVSKSFILKNNDYENLHRFAHEFCFEWILLSRDCWLKLSRNTRLRGIIENLFRTTPFVRKEKEWMERVIEIYFNNLDMRFRRDNRTAAGLVLQCMRCKKDDQQLFKDDDYATRIIRLESIYQEQAICYHLYQKLSERQNNHQ